MKRILHLPPLLVILLIYIPSFTFRLLSHDTDYDPTYRSTLFLLSSVWLTGCQTAWLWTSGVCLGEKLKPSDNSQLLLHKSCLLIPIGYVIMPLATIFSVFVPINDLFPFLTFDFYYQWHTVALVCFTYPIFFVAKSLTTLEQKKTATFGEYMTTIFTILIFPIGIFILQSRIKRVINSSIEDAYN